MKRTWLLALLMGGTALAASETFPLDDPADLDFDPLEVTVADGAATLLSSVAGTGNDTAPSQPFAPARRAASAIHPATRATAPFDRVSPGPSTRGRPAPPGERPIDRQGAFRKRHPFFKILAASLQNSTFKSTDY